MRIISWSAAAVVLSVSVYSVRVPPPIRYGSGVVPPFAIAPIRSAMWYGFAMTSACPTEDQASSRSLASERSIWLAYVVIESNWKDSPKPISSAFSCRASAPMSSASLAK